MLRVVDSVVSQITELSGIYIHFQKLIDGREDREQNWKECVDTLSKNLPFAIGSIYVEHYFKKEMKATVVEMFNNFKEEFTSMITDAEWIDDGTRKNLLYKLKSVIPLIAFPDGGFNEVAISEFYDGIKVDKSQYLRTLFQLRVIDADNKFRQTYPSTAHESSNEWRKYLPPTSVTALYSELDNTIRKIRASQLSYTKQAVINFDLFSRSGFSAGILQNIVNGHAINYLDYGSTGFIIAHEISHIVNQIVSNRHKPPPGIG